MFIKPAHPLDVFLGPAPREQRTVYVELNRKVVVAVPTYGYSEAELRAMYPERKKRRKGAA